MAKVYNLARMSTATTGTGTLTFGVAVSGHLTAAQAGAVDGDIVAYAIKDGSNSENGAGLVGGSVTTLVRYVKNSTNSNAAINLSGTAEVFITPRAEDMQPAIPGQLFGLTLSTAGSSSTFSVAAGRAADGTSIETMILASAISKTTSAWAVGSGNGGLDTGAIANNTWYHAHLIKRADTGVVDALVSLSGSSPTLPTNYTWARRIGSMLTDSSAHWTAFYQSGDSFLWSSPPLEFNNTSIGSNAAVLKVVTTPPGVVTEALLVGENINTGTANRIYFSTPNIAAVAPTAGLLNSIATVTVTTNDAFTVRVLTDTSSQIRLQAASASGNLYLSTLGWTDRRGRDS